MSRALLKSPPDNSKMNCSGDAVTIYCTQIQQTSNTNSQINPNNLLEESYPEPFFFACLLLWCSRHDLPPHHCGSKGKLFLSIIKEHGLAQEEKKDRLCLGTHRIVFEQSKDSGRIELFNGDKRVISVINNEEYLFIKICETFILTRCNSYCWH